MRDSALAADLAAALARDSSARRLASLCVAIIASGNRSAAMLSSSSIFAEVIGFSPERAIAEWVNCPTDRPACDGWKL
jgi:hypothetical protein